MNSQGVNFSFTIANETQFSRFFDMVAESVTDLSPVFKQLSKDFRETNEKAFNAQGAIEGRGGWQPLSFGYESWKMMNFPGQPILTLTGAMKQSLTQLGGDNIENIQKMSMEVGTRDPKATYHQKGTSKMPQRKIIDLSNEQKTRWTKITHDTIWKAMTKAEREAAMFGSVTGRR